MAEHVCPVWLGYLLASPIRKLFHNPKKILGHHVDEGMKVLDIGCAMGFFSLPLAEMVGAQGRVVCIDIQEGMVKSLEKRALKYGLSKRIEARICGRDSLGIDDLAGKIDFALAFAVVHEITDLGSFYSEVYEAIRSGGRFLVTEPRGHVSGDNFDAAVYLAEQKGFNVLNRFRKFYDRNALFEK